WLTAAQIGFFGNPTNAQPTDDVSPMTHVECITKEKSDRLCIAFIGFNEFTSRNETAVLNEIEAAKNISDYIIVMPHWGIEYEHVPRSSQIERAHSWIDNGADAVIGMHPHVIQSFEIYNNKPIFYSLGNFLFDQYFSYHTT